jgi:transposase InsO family protein
MFPDSQGDPRDSSHRWHVEGKAIQHVCVKPRTTRLNRKVERPHRTDASECYQLLSFSNDVDLPARQTEWKRFYNLVRPHGAHRGKTPNEIHRERLSSDAPCQAQA